MVHDIKVIRGYEGLFVSMPSRRQRNGEFRDIAHPLNQETRDWLENRVLDAYLATVPDEALENLDEAGQNVDCEAEPSASEERSIEASKGL